MFKRTTALLLSVILCFSFITAVPADEPVPQAETDESAETTGTTAEQEEQTEEQTEPTEEVTEEPTEAPTEATEAVTEAAETTTKTSSSGGSGSSSGSGRDTVTDEYDIELDEDDTEDLGSYVEGDPDEYSWRSDDTDVAKVSSKGIVRAYNRGTCTVTASATIDDTRYRYTFEISVDSVSGSKSFTIDTDETLDLYDYVDEDYDPDEYDWDSSNEKYVSVSSKGIVRGIKEGSATITADCGSRSYKFRITVRDEDSSKIDAKTDWDIYLGTDDQLDIGDLMEGDPDDYYWDVEYPDIIELEEYDGIITALDTGKTTVTADGDDDTYTFDIEVDDDYSTAEMKLTSRESKSIQSFLDYDVDEYSFDSDREDVITVTDKGRVTAAANGIGSVICEHDKGYITQIFITVTGINTTTTETTTETTTVQATTQKAAETTREAINFTDVSHRPWALDAIRAMSQKGYIEGVGNNKFMPDAYCKRCDFVIVLVRMLNLLNSGTGVTYPDVSAEDYFYGYVMTAQSNGISAGNLDNHFRPDDNITREEVMSMVYQGLRKINYQMTVSTTITAKNFSDASDIGPAYKEAIATLVNSGLILGTSDTTLEPKKPITRAQMAVLMNKTDQIVNK